MGFKSFFRKVSGTPARSLDQVDRMFTRKITYTDRRGESFQIQFMAKRDDMGYWEISDLTNKEHKQSLETALLRSDTLQAALMKHFGKDGLGDKMNFDEAFLVLRELEEEYRKRGATSNKEPFDHYMAAYRLLPQQFRESLDEVYQMRSGKGDVAPPQNTGSKPKNTPKPK